jgi:Skp family chaperone for outer membrane proteins
MAAGDVPPDGESGEPTRQPKLSKAERRIAAAAEGAVDRRRILPTQDWVSFVAEQDLQAVAQAQVLATSHFYSGLVNLKADFSRHILLPPPVHELPTQLLGTVREPDGTAGAGLAVTVLPFSDAAGATVLVSDMTVTDTDGHFRLTGLPAVKIADQTTITLQFRGANGKERRDFLVEESSGGILGDIQLKLALTPLQKSVVASLIDLVGALEPAEPQPARPGTAEKPITLSLGDGECRLDFSHDLPTESHRFSMLVRLVEPRPSIQTETLFLRQGDGGGIYPVAFRNSIWGGIPSTVRSFAERVPIDQPISVDGFRDRIVGLENNRVTEAETVPMAGTLGLGYVVHMAQQWQPEGLSLGDLVYSLPLAPGEQQRVAVFEQRQTLSTAELETLDFDEQQRASQVSDSSTDAVFRSAFAEHVRGSSSFTTSAESSSWGVAGGIGAAIGPVLLGIGAGGGGGSSSSTGQSSNSLDGSRDYLSTATSHAHSSIERQASARRHAQRTGMRLATASDVESVTTRVITNNNRIHALTMQYWEVLRHFSLTTAVDGVTLVCFVPLEIVRFMPPFVSYTLVEEEVSTRFGLLYRYGPLLKHADVLAKWIPFQYRQGLKVLEEFASNPRAQPSFTSATEDIVSISLVGSFLPIEDVYVSVVTRRGSRLGPVRLSGPITPLPDATIDPTHQFTSKTQLVAELLKRRAPTNDITLTANVTLPSSINPDDVVGFELSRRFRTLKYQLAPPAKDPMELLFGGSSQQNINLFFPWLTVQLDAQVNGVSMGPAELEAELGGPSIWGFSASIPGPPVETYAANVISASERFPLPGDGYPIAARSVAPLLKFNELLRIEAVLQHVVRNTVTYSRAVWMSLTPEERAIMLEAFTIGVPSDGLADQTQHVPLLNCVANQVLGFYGNAMIMPFNIPAEVTAVLTGDEDEGEEEPARPFTTAEIQKALIQFHRTGFAAPVSHVALPTQGVLGEAVLGECASAEKIDLTRFWNWGDSPIPQAADIAAGLLNKGSSLIGATAPSSLVGLPSAITNINAPPADATAALQALIAGQNTKDLPDITGLQELATLQGKTLDTAEKARADALAKAQTLASEGLSKAGDIMKAKAEAQKAQETKQQQAEADNQKAAAEKEKAQQARVQQGVASMRSGAANFLAVADAKPDQDTANAYAQQIVAQVFGGAAPPIEVASTLFTDYRRFQSGTSGPLTRGSTAFLRALGLVSG